MKHSFMLVFFKSRLISPSRFLVLLGPCRLQSPKWWLVEFICGVIMVNILLNKIKQDPVMTVNIQLNHNQAEVVGQFTANSPAANSTGWSCLPIRFKREIFTLFIRTSKRTVTFAFTRFFKPVQLFWMTNICCVTSQ